MLTNESVFPIPSQSVSKEGNAQNDYIFHEQIKLAYQQFHVCSLSSIGGYVILPILFWNQVSHFNLFLWLTLSILLLLVPPHILIRKYRNADEESKKNPLWSKSLVGIALIGSTAWGSMGIFLYPAHSLEHQLIIIFFICSGAAISTIVAASYPPLFWAKMAPNLLPFSIYALFQGDLIHTIMGLGIPIFYGGTLVLVHRNLHRNLLESLWLRLEKSHLVQQLEAKKQIAEKANAEKSRFLAAASHDLRQPLHAQMLLVDELKSHVNNEYCAQTVAKLEGSMNAMNGLFNELLDISKLDACTIKPSVREFPLQPVLDELALDFSELAKNQQLQLRIHPSNAIVKSDRTLLSRILRNFVSNAIRHTHRGGVLIGCRRRSGKLIIQVWDSGPGIAEKERELIFDEFYQINNPERDRNKGLGLGLSIVARLAKLLNHKIIISSVVQKGSVFSLEVPIGSKVSLIPHGNSELSAIKRDFTDVKVLLLEDDELILSTMRHLLLKWGCIVFAASSYESALNHIGSLVNGLHLIVADYRLKNNTTGMQVIDKLEMMLKTKVPTVVVTGDTSPVIIQEIQQSGRCLLHKPVAPDKLRTVMGEVLAMQKNQLAN